MGAEEPITVERRIRTRLAVGEDYWTEFKSDRKPDQQERPANRKIIGTPDRVRAE